MKTLNIKLFHFPAFTDIHINIVGDMNKKISRAVALHILLERLGVR
jgi:hypothetical protein